MTHPKVVSDPRLRQRYGIKDANRNWIWPAIISILLVATWFIWGGINAANPNVRSELISFKVLDNKTVAITYTISVKDIGIDHSCSVVARDLEKNVIGEITDQIAANSLMPGKNQRSIEISTRLPAVNAGISSCQ